MLKSRVITSKDVPAYKVIDTSASQKICTLELVDKAKITDQKTGDYVIEQVPTITETIDTQEYIQSFAGDVGIENILRKFDLIKDPDLLNQVNRPTVPIAEDGKEEIQDYTNLPQNEEDALRMALNARSEFENLPDELVKGRSFNEFAETCSKEELMAYINSLQQKKESE